MSNFKLIAIRAKERCHQNFRKNLQEGEFYKFYNHYVFLNKSKLPLKKGETVWKVIFTEEKPSDLYYVQTLDKRNIALNISAVAGKNGAGKSTLAELFFAMVYVFSERTKVMDHNTQKLKAKKKEADLLLKELRRRDAGGDIFREVQDVLNRSRDNVPGFESLRSYFSSYEEAIRLHHEEIKELENEGRYIDEELEEIKRVASGLKAEIIFQASSTIFSLAVDDSYPQGYAFSKVGTAGEEKDETIIRLVRDVQLNKILDMKSTISKLFFYTIAVNYSSYSLNSNVIGDWITSLFHKNDGYKTPLVINPMRTEGRFDVNEENRFAKYRLLSNLLSTFKGQGDKGDLFLTETQSVKAIHFTLNEQKVEHYRITDLGTHMKGSPAEFEFIDAIYGQFISSHQIAQMRKGLGPGTFNLISNYLLQKLEKICHTYDGFSYPETAEEAFELAKKIKEDDTHITFKMRQAVNFIIHIYENKGQGKNFIKPNKMLAKSVEFSPKELLEWMGSPDYGDIINHLPFSVFSIDIELLSKTGEKSRFDLLSSGEQQFIHVMQSVLYHIINIESISNSQDRLSYNAVNVIFDEVELYFHPELQRRFVNELRDAISRLHLNGKHGITAINILFLTHSPFILSDIPSSNVLLLDRNDKGKTIVKESENQTFAANINDLLADNFFLNETLVGAFAEKKIEDLIKKIDKGDYNPQDDGSIVDLIGDSYLKASITNLIKNHD